eukprot:761032-Hanusia_phi.AAC.15
MTTETRRDFRCIARVLFVETTLAAEIRRPRRVQEGTRDLCSCSTKLLEEGRQLEATRVPALALLLSFQGGLQQKCSEYRTKGTRTDRNSNCCHRTF